MDNANLISMVLGYAIMLGAVGLKLPQILSIVKNGSADGLSAISLYLDVALIMTHCIYNYVQVIHN